MRSACDSTSSWSQRSSAIGAVGWLTPWYAHRMTSIQIAVRLPGDQVERMDRVAKGLHTSRSDVIRRALELYLYRLDCERDARIYEREPLKRDELAFTDDPDAWTETPPW